MRLKSRCIFFAALTLLLTSIGGAQDSDSDTIHYRPLHTWSFMTDAKHGWHWMAEVLQHDEAGALLLVKENGPFMRFDGLSQRALDVAAAEIVIDYWDGAENKGPKAMRLYWARAADTERGGNWPFSNERSAPFLPLEGDPASRWRADIAFHGNWIGTITALFVEVTLHDGTQEAGGRLLLSELNLLEELWESDNEDKAKELEE